MIEKDFEIRINSIKTRISLRLPGYDYAQAAAYYVTICVNQHRCLFGEVVDEAIQLNAVGLMVHQLWLELGKKFTSLRIDEFVVMPNHIHAIIVLTEGTLHGDRGEVGNDVRERVTLSRVIQWFKTMTTNKYIRSISDHNWPAFDRHFWQRGYYEHIIRNDDDLRRIREYIANNPMRWSIDKYHPSRISYLK